MEKNVWKRITSSVFNVLFYMTIVLMLIFSVANMKIRAENDIAHIFKTGFLSVQSNSMAGEEVNSFHQGDLVFVNMLSDQEKMSLDIGTVVTFYDHQIKSFNTHRIVDIYVINDEVHYITQGDAVSEPDQTPLYYQDVIATYQDKLTGLGTTLDYVQSSSGFLLVIILPVLIILIIEGTLLAKHAMQHHKTRFEEKFRAIERQAMSDLELEKERIRQQIISELQLNK